jgi:N-hydroxyarylamine O-acetyltransferase
LAEEPNLDAYLKRVNFSGSIAPGIDLLASLHQLHPAAIAFENLDPLMDVPVRLDLSSLEQKLVVERRGGYCFEHNLLFKAILDDLGFVTHPLAARVLTGAAAEGEAPLNHMVLSVDLAGVTYLVDVGFGGNVMTAPLRLKAGLEQETPNGRYRLTGGEPVWTLEAEIAGAWSALFAFELIERSHDEYRAMNDLTQVSFRDDLRVARSEPGVRYALRNNRFNIHRLGGETETRALSSTFEIRDVLTQSFGIELPRDDARLDTALEKAFRPRHA